MNPDGRFSLAECLSELRSEILAAHHSQMEDAARSTDPKRPVFLVEKLSLQLEVVAMKSDKMDGKLQFWIMSAGASADATSSSKQILTLHLQMAESLPLGEEKTDRF
jgi:hypothetical protein